MAKGKNMPDKRPRHGLHALKKRLKVDGLNALDRRCSAVKALLAWKRGLIADLGGAENISASKMTLLDMAARTRLLLENIDAYILMLPSIVNKKKRCVIPVVQQREQLAASLASLLQRLGLERQARPVKSLAEYVAEKRA